VRAGRRGLRRAGLVGRRLAIGEAELEVAVGCPRCVMITTASPTCPRPRLMRTVVKEADQNVGVYARVVRPAASRSATR